MVRDPLLILHALRQRTVEQARETLGACLKAEAEAMGRIRTLDDDARRDSEAVGPMDGEHRFLDMFVFRQVSIRTGRRSAAADLAAAETCSAEARAAVAAARTAAEAVDQLIGERAATVRVGAARREQHELDDIVRPCRAIHPHGQAR